MRTQMIMTIVVPKETAVEMEKTAREDQVTMSELMQVVFSQYRDSRRKWTPPRAARMGGRRRVGKAKGR